jgi:signal transduction histidine kinase/ActR/RegA family two-component response regulator
VPIPAHGPALRPVRQFTVGLGRRLHILLKRYYRRIKRPLIQGVLAGGAVLLISSLGLLYLWHAAREAQLDAVRTELTQLARTAAELVDGDLHRSITSQEQAGSPAHLALLAPLVKFHKATSDIIYVYTAILDRDRIYYILGTDYLYRVPGDTEPTELIMAPHDTVDPTLRRALERHEVAVNQEPVQERVRSYMSAYAPFYDHSGRFVGVVGIDMWLRDFDARMSAIWRAGIGAFAAVALLSLLAGFVVLRLSSAAQRARRRDRVVQLRLAEAKKHAEAQAQRAQAASRAKSDLLAVMSHEIRTPMSGVLGFTSLLLDTPLNQEQREFAETMQRSGDALLTVVNDVLDYSKLESGRMTVEHIDVALESVCDGVRSILQSAALERGVGMRVEYDPRLPKHIKGDPVRIRQVLLNLVGNAVKFTEHGSVLIAATELDATRVKISVTDTGIGITAEQMATLFERYTQADPSTARRYGGTGLGLAISKTLVGLMGGEIGVESHPGTGSTFWFVLPLHAADAAAAAAPTAEVAPAMAVTSAMPATPAMAVSPPAAMGVSPPAAMGVSPPAAAAPTVTPAAAAPPSEPVADTMAAPPAVSTEPVMRALATMASDAAMGGKAAMGDATMGDQAAIGDAAPLSAPPAARVTPRSPAGTRLLLVEDNFVNQRVALYMLAKLGYRVDVAKNGREAIDRLRKTRYDLVFMDCHMPEMDGFEATQFIRDKSSAVLDHEVPIVAMTANAFSDDRTRSLDSGMNDFLSKPVYQTTLAAMLDKWLTAEPLSAASST